MQFKITFQPTNRIAGVTPTTVLKDTAAEAWKAVHELMMSDEKVTINDGAMGWEELQLLAEGE